MGGIVGRANGAVVSLLTGRLVYVLGGAVALGASAAVGAALGGLTAGCFSHPIRQGRGGCRPVGIVVRVVAAGVLFFMIASGVIGFFTKAGSVVHVVSSLLNLVAEVIGIFLMLAVLLRLSSGVAQKE